MKNQQAASILISALFLLLSAPASADRSEGHLFLLPSFRITEERFNKPIPSLKRTPTIDVDQLFQAVIHCYPVPSKFGALKVDLRAGAGFQMANLDRIDVDGIGGHYIGLALKWPLFDQSERDREYDREFQRRDKAAKLIATFVKSVAARNKAIRMIGINSTLELWSQARVRRGIAPVKEQVGALKDLIVWEEKLETAKAEIESSRLSLVGQCMDVSRGEINRVLLSYVNHDGA